MSVEITRTSQSHPELVSGSHSEPFLEHHRGQMLKFAVKREQRHACLNFAEREQIEQR
jgi:hypothetical protein